MTTCQKLSFPPMSGSLRRLLLTLTAAFLATALHGQSPAAPAGGHTQAPAQASQSRKPFAPSLPLFFEKNDGQFDGRAGFLARMPNATLYLTGADAVLVHSTKATDEASAIRMHWAGASGAKAPVGVVEMTGRSNYFIGNDQSRWHTGVENFQRVQENDLYPGVDLVYYGNQQQLEYDLTVHPGASPSAIRFAIEGAKSIALDKATGDLVLVDAVGSPLRLLKPVVYQLDDNLARTSISGAYAISSQNAVSFVLGDYDHSRQLVIDPEVVYSTMFGGTTLETASEGTSPNNLYTGMTVDSNGDVYLSGVFMTAAHSAPTSSSPSSIPRNPVPRRSSMPPISAETRRTLSVRMTASSTTSRSIRSSTPTSWAKSARASTAAVIPPRPMHSFQPAPFPSQGQPAPACSPS